MPEESPEERSNIPRRDSTSPDQQNSSDPTREAEKRKPTQPASDETTRIPQEDPSKVKVNGSTRETEPPDTTEETPNRSRSSSKPRPSDQEQGEQSTAGSQPGQAGQGLGKSAQAGTSGSGSNTGSGGKGSPAKQSQAAQSATNSSSSGEGSSTQQGQEEQTEGGSPDTQNNERAPSNIEQSGSSGSGSNSQGSPSGPGQAQEKSGGSSGTPTQGGQGGGHQSARQTGGGGSSDIGGGGATGPGAVSGEPAKDDSKPSPPAQEPEDPFGDTVAPQGQPQTDLVLRKLNEALQDDQRTKDLEQRTGFSRELLEQFARKYEKPNLGPAGPGREIELKPGEQTAAQQPSPNLPGVDRTLRHSTKNLREKGTMPQDTIRDMNQGVRFEPPREWKGKWEGYLIKLARSKVTPPRRTAKPSPSSGQ
jgi:hypothetical protein